MAKLTREDKVEIYRRRKIGMSISVLANEYGVGVEIIKHLVRLIDYHGEDVLRNEKNRTYSVRLKEEIINKVLIDGQSNNETAVEYGLSSSGMLTNWIKSYKENNYVIVEKTKGKKKNTMTKTEEVEKRVDYADMSDEEKIQYLERRNLQLEKSNLYLEAEAEYLKKLHAVVQKSKQQQKKK